MAHDEAVPRERCGAVRLALATGLGTGFAPIAPGTAGSLPGVALYAGSWLLRGWPAALGVLAVVTAVGVWAADGAESHFGRKDPGQVVIDEVAGQMLALLFVEPSLRTLAAGFFLFRLFDVIKPYPARRLERWPGGSGIMADDLVAGLYANLALQAALRWLPGVMGIA